MRDYYDEYQEEEPGKKTFLVSQIGDGETVIWQGKPDKKAFILKSVFNTLLPISIVWCCFDLSILFFGFSDDEQFSLVLIPFLLLHMAPVWIYLGNILFAFRRYRNTSYLVTDKYVYVSGGSFTRNVSTRSLCKLSDLHIHVGSVEKMCHVGSVVLGGYEQREDGWQTNQVLEIACVPNYEDLFRKIHSLQDEASADFQFPNDYR